MHELFVYFGNKAFLVASFANIFPKKISTGAGTTRSHMQKNKVGPLFPSLYKINSKWIKSLDVRTKIIHPIEENRREKVHDLEFAHDFLDLLPKAQTTKDKRDKLDFFKTKVVVHKMSKQKYLPHKMAQDVCRSCTWWRSVAYKPRLRWSSGVPVRPLLSQVIRGFQAPQDVWAGHWSSSAPSRRECWMVLSLVPSHHCPQRREASICRQKNTESLQGFENQETILHFLEKCILLQSSDFFQCGSHGVLRPSLFLWKWPGKFGCLQFPHQVTRPVGPGPGGPSFHCILTQTLRLRLKSPCFSIKNSHLLTFSSELNTAVELLLQNMATRCLHFFMFHLFFLFLCILCCFILE